MGGVMRRYELRFGLLGPPVLYDASDVLPIGSPKVRTLLAALLLEAGRVVSVESLREALWGGAPPVSARASLHNHVTRLRRLLDDPERLRAVPPGYLLRVDDGELDVDVFDARVAQARAAHGRREWAPVLRACADALALWRGSPLGGLPADFGGRAFVQRLEEARLLLLEWRYDAELALGGPWLGGVAPELAALVAEYPLREAYHRQLMLALHRTGRQAEALAVHRDLRNRLRDDLGIEPGPAVRRAHVEVLRGSGATGEALRYEGGSGRGARHEGASGVGARHEGASGRGTPYESASGRGAPDEGASGEGMSHKGASGETVPDVGSSGDGVLDEGGAGAGTSWPVAQFPAPPRGASTGRRSKAECAVERVERVERTESAEATTVPVAPRSTRDDSPAPRPAQLPPSPAHFTGRTTVIEELTHTLAPPPPAHSTGRTAVVEELGRALAHFPGLTAAHPEPTPTTPDPVAAPRPETTATALAPAFTEPGPPAFTEPHPPAAADGASAPQGPPAPDHETVTGGAGGNTKAEGEAEATATRPRPRPTLTVISGMAGVGKSALALHVAHQLRDRFPDGQLYVNLHGATPGMPPLAPGQALAALLRDLGADPRHIPEHPDAATALLRSLLAPTRTLLLLDDAANAAQVRPLLPGGPGCAVIVTSRSPLTALDGAHRFPLGPLTGEDSAALLRAVSGRAEIGAGHPLVGLTGRLPLALRVVAARLAARRALTPEMLARQLADTEGRLHHLEYDDLSVRRSLAVAHDALAASGRASDRDAALVLRHVGTLDLPTYGAPLIARLTGTDERRAEAALDRLVDVALLEETAYGRYTPHDLLRDFARELAEEPGGTDGSHPTDRTEAALTALRWFAAVAERALVAILEPGLDQGDRRRPTTAQPPEHQPYAAALPPFECAEHAFAWGDMELENIVALVERYAGTTDARISAYLSTLVRLLYPYVLRSGRVAEMEVLGTAALAAARRLADEPAEAYALGDLAGLRFLTGRQREALALTDGALALWRRLGAASWIRRGLNNRGLLLEGLGRYDESGEALRQSLDYSRQLNDPYGEAVTHSHLGNLYEHTDPRAAIEQHRRSLAIGDAIGAVILQHSAHCNIGYAHLSLAEPAAAAAHFEESLRILGGHGDWHGESQTRLGLVRALRALGRTDRAHHECTELLRRADARADRYSGGLARHQLGLLLCEQGRTGEAYGVWREALTALDGTDEPDVLAELRDLLAPGDRSDRSDRSD
ncbi:BTAD domain-containing putative transcriptional regulator [Streptomyces sp. NPDC058457]|uniref:AfsR/SARP family transcriptional regulator n=1 Tax=Streptomyces sp. NPDC058457 TaxID=3346507 RepID=UPI0036537F50